MQCLEHHRNRLLINRSFGISEPAAINECEASELSELISTVDTAVQHGFNPASAQDSSSKIARLAWMAGVALLDDAVLQLADLPLLKPNTDGLVVFAEVPQPKRSSSKWKNVETTAKQMSASDSDVKQVAEAMLLLVDGS